MPEQRQPSPEEMEALQEKIKNMSPEELKEFQKKQCIFCQIIEGKVQAKKIYEDEKSIAILDINPANPGHILLLPKEHYSVMPQIPEEEVSHLFMVSKFLSNAILKTLEASGTNIMVANGPAAGQKAQHFMIHVIPRKEDDGIEFTLPQKKHSDSDLDTVAGKIREKLAGILKVKQGQLVKKPTPKPVQKPALPAPEAQAPAPKVKAPKPVVEAVVKEAEEPEEEAEEKPKPAKKAKKKPAKKKAKAKPKEEKKKEPKPHKEEPEPEVNLDDIANVLGI